MLNLSPQQMKLFHYVLDKYHVILIILKKKKKYSEKLALMSIRTNTRAVGRDIRATACTLHYPCSGLIVSNFHKSKMAVNFRVSPRFGHNIHHIYLLAYYF